MSPQRSVAALAATALMLASPGPARGDTPPPINLTAAVIGASPVPYSQTTLGKATHHVRLTYTNGSRERVAVTVTPLHYVARREGIDYSCEERDPEVERTPRVVEPGAATSSDRWITCETPLPGDYEVAISASADGGRMASFALSIGAGANAPVRLPWPPGWWAAAMITPEVRPTPGPATSARVVVALVNGTREVLPLDTQTVRLRTTARGASSPACPEQVFRVEATGTLAPGRVHSTWLALRCDLSSETFYDVDVFAEPPRGGGAVKVAGLVLRVRSGPILPLPMPMPR